MFKEMSDVIQTSRKSDLKNKTLISLQRGRREGKCRFDVITFRYISIMQCLRKQTVRN